MSGEEKAAADPKPVAPAAPNAFTAMMRAQRAQPKRKWFPKPRGPTPRGKKWDGFVEPSGAWVNQDGVDEGGDRKEDESDEGTEPAAKKRYRCFQASWKLTLSSLICVSCLPPDAACTVKNCPGCSECARLYCTDCQNDGCSNAFVAGSKYFHLNGVRLHKEAWHRPRAGGDIAEGLAQTIDAHKEKIKGVMRNVLWLAKEKIALRKLASLCDLVELHGVVLGKHYVNHVAARDFTLSIAHVLRMRIINAARISPALGLMVDESTDVGKHGNSILYLRLLMGGIFVTVFYRIAQVSDASAEGLASLITETFEQDGVPKSRLYSFASDGASVMTGAENGVAARLRDLFCLFVRARVASCASRTSE